MTSAPMKLDGTVLGFDVGARRIGVAVGSAYGSGARALAVIDVHAHGPDWSTIDRLRAEWRPDGLVVGDPMTMDGGDGIQCGGVATFLAPFGAVGGETLRRFD